MGYLAEGVLTGEGDWFQINLHTHRTEAVLSGQLPLRHWGHGASPRRHGNHQGARGIKGITLAEQDGEQT